MIYNGFDFAPWFDTRLITRSLLPEYEIATRDVPGQPGSRFMRADLKPLTIDVAAAWRARPTDDMAALRRLMASRLMCLKEAELWLDDERHLGLRYMAVLTSPGALDTLWHTGEATLTFTAYDPVAYGAEGRATVSGTSGVQVGGTFRTYPTVTVRPGGSTSALRLTNMGTGEFVQIDKAVTASSAVVIDMAAPQATEQGQRHAHRAGAIDQDLCSLGHAEVLGGRVALCQGQQHARVNIAHGIREFMLLDPGEVLLRKTVLQHGLVVADHAVLRHAAVGLGVSVANIRVEIGMEPPLSHVDVADLFAHGHHLAGTLVAQHCGIDADAVAQVAAGAGDNLHIGAVAESASVDLHQRLVIAQNRLGNVIHHPDVIGSHNRDCLHVLHIAHSLF